MKRMDLFDWLVLIVSAVLWVLYGFYAMALFLAGVAVIFLFLWLVYCFQHGADLLDEQERRERHGR